MSKKVDLTFLFFKFKVDLNRFESILLCVCMFPEFLGMVQSTSYPNLTAGLKLIRLKFYEAWLFQEYSRD